MKKLWMFLSLIGLACTGMAQNVPSYVPTNGLVGWWPFNGNANDESGNGNNGTVNGATLTSDRFGSAGKAYSFDGIDDYIDFGDSAAFDFSSSSFSISLWVNRLQLNNTSNYDNSFVVGKWDHGTATPGQNEFAIVFNNIPMPINTVGFYLESGSNLPGISTNSTVSSNDWTNIFVKRNIDSIHIFINGRLQQSGYIGNIQINNVGRSMLLGSYFPNNPFHITPWNFTNANFDDLVVWNRALTQQEITNLYNASTSAPAPCPSLPVNLQNGLVGYWPFCGNANDESGNGNNGTVNGATLTSDRFGNTNKSYSFDGVSNEITVQHNNSLNVLPITISVWFSTAAVSQQTIGLVNKYGCLTSNGYGFHLTNNKPSGYYYFNSNPNTTTDYLNLDPVSNNFQSLNNDEWHNGILVVKSDSAKLYIDGQLIYQNAVVGTLSVTNTIENLRFGSYPVGICTGPKLFYKGKIDDICIWNRALDSTEINQLYQTQSSNSSQGNVGINVIAPQRNLHVKDVIRLEPRSTPPDNPVFGDMYIDAVLKKLRVYDGTAWQNCW